MLLHAAEKKKRKKKKLFSSGRTSRDDREPTAADLTSCWHAGPHHEIENNREAQEESQLRRPVMDEARSNLARWCDALPPTQRASRASISLVPIYCFILWAIASWMAETEDEGRQEATRPTHLHNHFPLPATTTNLFVKRRRRRKMSVTQSSKNISINDLKNKTNSGHCAVRWSGSIAPLRPHSHGLFLRRLLKYTYRRPS